MSEVKIPLKRLNQEGNDDCNKKDSEKDNSKIDKVNGFLLKILENDDRKKDFDIFEYLISLYDDDDDDDTESYEDSDESDSV